MKNRFETTSFTNEQLEKEFGKELATGKVVMVHTEETKNPEWLSCYFAQKREVASRGSAPSAGLSSITKQLKGFDASSNIYIIRHIETLNVKALESANLRVGSTLDAVIGITDKNEPMTPNQKPHMNAAGEERLSGGKKVYTHTCLTTVEEYAGDQVMKFDYVAATKTVAASEFSQRSKVN